MPRAPLPACLAVAFALALVAPLAHSAATATPAKTPTKSTKPATPALKPSDLPAATIVDKNVAARGGLAAWRAVRTLSWSGKMDAGGNNEPPLRIPGTPPPPKPKPGQAEEQVQLPFRLELQRPRMQRLELDFAGQTAVQVYDGTKGWKLRPYLNRSDVEPFTPEEMKAVATQADLDGHLVDYAAKGTKIDVEGIENVEGQPAYKLKLTLKRGQVLHEWVDKTSFLEVRIEGTPRRIDGRPRAVLVYLRDYRKVDGLAIPQLLETTVAGVKRTEKIQIEKVTVNPPLDASRFTKPG
jgi:outer membrane lipoprotein-sorting protein